jgi:hypothetical protein
MEAQIEHVDFIEGYTPAVEGKAWSGAPPDGNESRFCLYMLVTCGVRHSVSPLARSCLATGPIPRLGEHSVQPGDLIVAMPAERCYFPGTGR